MRRALLVSALSAALLLTASCGSEEDPGQATVPATSEAPADTAPETSEAPHTESPSSTTTAPPETTTTTAPSATATSSDTATTPPAEPTDTATGSPTTTEAAPPPPPPGGECSSGAYAAGPLNAGDAPAAVVDTGNILLEAAVACDSATLVDLATSDGTSLSFGGGSPEELLGLPDVEGRYLALAVLLSGTTPATTTVEGQGPVTVWPAAFAEGATDADWQEIVDAGLYTQAEVDQMRAGGGYYGWRVGIAEDGTWQFFIAGD